jgi:NAD(P)H-quinone oxidoreductase subunit 5
MFQLLLQTSWWIPCYGLVGALLTLPWALGLIQRSGPRPAAYFNLLMTVIAFGHGSLLLRGILQQPVVQQFTWHWLQVPDLDLSVVLEISPLSVGAIELITGLSLLAQFYAIGYMERDWALARFFALMGFFEAAMSGLAMSNSLFLSYALLEMLTLSTYLLVGFWYAQPLVVTAARDAFLTKRVGDVLLLMSVVALCSLAGSLNFPDLYAWAATADLAPGAAMLLGLGLIAGPIAKCAQFPLHLWLDEAMEGPNPASILRNSVVVGCGAYVLIKLQPILLLSPIVLDVLVIIGSVTAIGACLMAIAQIDMKRSLSHSTSAYLGLVFIAVGLQQTQVAWLLLGTHAVAKALMFISSGSVIQTTTCQDVTEMGGLWSRMPATTTGFVVSSAGLLGIFPLGGFWAMQAGVKAFAAISPVFAVVILLVNFLTALNLERLFRLVFLCPAQPKSRRAAEVPWPMAVPLVSLIVLTLGVPLSLHRLQLLPAPETIDWLQTGLLVASGLMGWGIGSLIYLNRVWSRSLNPRIRMLQDFLAYDFYVERLYRVTIVWVVSVASRVMSWCDRYLIDGAVNLAAFVSLLGGEALKYGTSGQSQAYVLTIVAGLSVLMGLLLWSLTGVFPVLSFRF